MIISIITISFNDLTGLRRTVNSIDAIFSKTIFEKQVEHVVIDGGSADGTKQFLLSLERDRAVHGHYISESDFGIYHAMNKGVNIACGKFLIFLNAGDEIYHGLDVSTFFESLSKCSLQGGEAGLAYSALLRFRYKSFKISSRTVNAFAPSMPSIHQSMIFKRLVLLHHPFDISWKICGDYDNFARIFSTGLRFHPIDALFCIFYAGGISSKRPFQLFRESSRITNRYFYLGPYRSLVIKSKLILSIIIYQIFLRTFGIVI